MAWHTKTRLYDCDLAPVGLTNAPRDGDVRPIGQATGTRVLRTRAVRMSALVSVVVLASAVLPACVELGLVSSDASIAGGSGQTSSDMDGDTQPTGDGGAAPQVGIAAIPSTPAVGETVTLTCSVIGGEATGVTFEFQTSDGRPLDPFNADTVTFVVDETDVGTSLEFTCTGTTVAGTGPPSVPVIVIPVAAGLPGGIESPFNPDFGDTFDDPALTDPFADPFGDPDPFDPFDPFEPVEPPIQPETP